MTRIRKLMLEELQGGKCLHWCRTVTGRFFDTIPETSKLSDRLPGAQLLRSFADCEATFLVADPFMQDQPNQAALSMGDGPDRLIVS